MQVKQRTPRRDRERVARRADILAAARQVFARRGYANATLDEIAARAEFAKGTIYNYFTSKEEIFLEAVASVIDQLRLAGAPALEGDAAPREALRSYAATGFRLFGENRDFILIVAREMTRLMFDRGADPGGLVRGRMRLMQKDLAGYFRRQIRAGHFRHVDPDEIAQLFGEMIRMRAIKGVHCRPAALDPDGEARFLVGVLLDGMLAVPGAPLRGARKEAHA